ncbi:Y-family DNA polymerase [Mycoplasmopsis alligatoris]|uniref:ImpB/MucB/SamB family protein n=1 Tax=Mycoplasmopsis alligatoris A21JP2 TaxID=747682 RepID=D4XV03_9BACT|nr:DNA polymerase IV [Mycoplasmopsis alligatoris]EFF41818.1 ImpB/MucB/SamB family protein [Mycoplasmopsis alligatoris A21JP2]
MSYNHKIIFHVDFDSYFVSAARTLRPELKNKPVAIGKKHSGAIATSISYELKNLKFKPGDSIWKIKQTVPNLVVVEPHFELYTFLSSKIFDYLHNRYSKIIEIVSIDECFIDVTNIASSYQKAYDIAKKIQNDVLNLFKIPLTIGISYNKFLAKMTTNINKPFGIGITTKEQIAEHFYHLKLEKFYGIGSSTAQKLEKIGLKTIGDLATKESNSFLINDTLGIVGKDLIIEAKGLGSDHVKTENNDLKSIGNSLTFESFELDTREDIFAILKSLILKVSTRADNRNLVGNVVTLLIRKKGRGWNNKQVKLESYINKYKEILEVANLIFNKVYNEEKIIGIGIKLSNLINYFDLYKKTNLFTSLKKENKIEKIIDQVNYKTGKKSVFTLYEYKKNKIKDHSQSKFLLEDTIFKKH